MIHKIIIEYIGDHNIITKGKNHVGGYCPVVRTLNLCVSSLKSYILYSDTPLLIINVSKYKRIPNVFVNYTFYF